MTEVAVLTTGLAVLLATRGLTGALSRRLGPRRVALVAAHQAWLGQTGTGLTPLRLAGAAAACGALAFSLLTPVAGAPAVAAVPALCVAVAPYAALARRRERRLGAVRAAWPDGLREVVAAVSAGSSLTQALGELARSGPAALRVAFARFEPMARAVGTVPALEAIKAELADPTSDRVIEVLVLAHERGGRIVTEILRDLADAATEDLRTAEAIATAGLEQRINARAVFALPWAVLVVLTMRDGPFRDFYRGGGGLLVIAVAAAASLVGLAVATRLARQPVEQRVLSGRSEP